MNRVKKSYTILIVEDEDADLYLAESTISLILDSEDIQHNILTSTTSKGGLELIKAENNSIDLMLLDINLSNSPQDGHDLLRSARVSNGILPPPIVGMLTTSNRSNDILKSVQSHADFYLEKSEDIDDFESGLSVLLNYYLLGRAVDTSLLDANLIFWRKYNGQYNSFNQ